jgi:ParB family chromosome partitioning protein
MVTKKQGPGPGPRSPARPKVNDTPAPEREGTPSTLKLEQMQAGKLQPRTRMDEGSLYELAESIKGQGIMQPILVRPIAANGAVGYEIIAGERRFRARRWPACARCRCWSRRCRTIRRRNGADREHPARRPQPAGRGPGPQALTDEFGLTHEQAAQAVGARAARPATCCACSTWPRRCRTC